jgi:hypothetical protein
MAGERVFIRTVFAGSALKQCRKLADESKGTRSWRCTSRASSSR